MAWVNQVTYNLNDVDEKILKKIFKDYFFKHKLYVAKVQETHIDLHYHLIPTTDQMYKQLNNAGEPLQFVRDKSKFIYAHKIPSDTVMNNKFIKMLDSKGYKELIVPREKIENAILSLVDEKAALILKELYPDIKLKKLLVHLSNKDALKLENKILKLNKYKKYRALKNAIDTLIEYLKVQ